MLIIMQSGTLYFVIADILIEEGNFQKAAFVGAAPLFVLLGAAYAYIFNYKLERNIKAKKNA